MGPIAALVYDWCMAAAADRKPRPAPLATAAAQISEMKAQFGPLVSPMTRDLDVARTALADLRQQVDGLTEVLDEMLA